MAALKSRPLHKDPAPSRLAYRVQRLLLTPLFWRALRWGVPLVVVAAVVAIWLGDPARREALAGAASELRRQIEERPEFTVQVMAVDGASPELSAEIRRNLRLRLPISSFDLDLPALRTAVAELDPVAGVRVFIRPGGVLQVEVEERIPAVVQRGPEGLRLLDPGGHPVAPLAARDDRADLPLIAGTGAERAVAEVLALHAAAEPLEARLRGFVRVGERRWDVVLDRGQRILLPETEPVAALDHVIALDRAQDLLARDIVAVDLRDPRRPTLRLSPEAADALHAARAAYERTSQR